MMVPAVRAANEVWRLVHVRLRFSSDRAVRRGWRPAPRPDRPYRAVLADRHADRYLGGAPGGRRVPRRARWPARRPNQAPARTSVAAVPDPFAPFETLTFDRSEPDVLQIVLDAPHLNAVGPKTHQELADVWLAVDREPRRCGSPSSGPPAAAFSAGGSYELLDQLNDRLRRPDPGDVRGAADIVFNVINCSKPIVSAIHGPAVGAGLVCRVAGRHLHRHPRPRSSTATPASASPPATTPPSAGPSSAAWPRPSTTC